jgi:hypothetical protein
MSTPPSPRIAPSDVTTEITPTAAPIPAPPDASAHKGRGRGARGQRLVRHFKIDHALTPEDRAQYEALLLDPRSTVDSLLKWLHEKGYSDVSRGGVQRHRKQFELDIKDIRRDARVAGQFAALARFQAGPTVLADAGQFRFEQMFLEHLFRMEKGGERAAKEWLELGRAMAAVLGNRREVEEQRAPKGPAGRKAIDGNALSDKVRRALGMPLPGQPVPGDPRPAPALPALPALPAPEASVDRTGAPPARPFSGLPSPSDN